MSTKEERSSSEPQDSDLDAEGEEADEEYEQASHTTTVAPTKRVVEEPESDGDAEGEDDDVDADGSIDSGDADDMDAASDETSEPEENASWQQESEDDGDEVDDKIADSNLCIYCGETEENDPSDDYEEYLECSNCSDNSHRQCARDNGTFDDDSNAEEWSCARCIEAVAMNGDGSAVAADAATTISQQGNTATIMSNADSTDEFRAGRKRTSDDGGLMPRAQRKRRRIAGDDDQADQLENGVEEEMVDGTTGRSARSRRSNHQNRPMVDIVSSEGVSLILAFSLNRYKMQKILASRPRKNRWREKMRRKIQLAQVEEPEPAHYPALPPGYGNNLFEMSDRDLEDKKPYGGILNDAEADTSKTFPQTADRKRFEDARTKAEEDWKQKMAAIKPTQDSFKPLPKTSGPPSKIKCINFGGYEIDTWNAAPYPEEYSRNRILYICEFCLKYMNSDYVAWRHKLKCPAQHPPGDEIYRDGKYSFFEVDGRKNPVYCQNLCLLAKLFLGSKTLYYDVEPFLFYVMTENDELGCHFVGYFSKEKRPSSLNNVSCILVLPIYQRRGFGHMLIEFSYLLTKKEEKTGSPEKPLSDMGLVSYRGYWRLVMCYNLVDQKAPLSISELSKRTGMTPDDVVSALEGLRALVRDPVTKTYALRLDMAFFKDYIDKYEKKNYPRINPEASIWTKYLMNRGMMQMYEVGGALQTVAPREEEHAEELEAAKQDIEASDAQNMVQVNGFEVEMADADPAEAQDHEMANGAATHSQSPATPVRNEDIAGMTNGHGDTDLADSKAPIPPSRFEVFPPFPGQYARRRGRPPGSGRRTYVEAQVTDAATESTAEQAMVNGSPTLRRSRSGLSESVMVNGVDEDEDGSAAPTRPTSGIHEAVNGNTTTSDDDVEADAEGEEE